MPGVAQGLQKFVPSLNREVTSMAAGTEKSVIIYSQIKYRHTNTHNTD